MRTIAASTHLGFGQCLAIPSRVGMPSLYACTPVWGLWQMLCFRRFYHFCWSILELLPSRLWGFSWAANRPNLDKSPSESQIQIDPTAGKPNSSDDRLSYNPKLSLDVICHYFYSSSNWTGSAPKRIGLMVSWGEYSPKLLSSMSSSWEKLEMELTAERC